MFIENTFDVYNTFICGTKLAKYLESKGIPILGKSNNKCIFSKTNQLEEVLNNMSWLEKLIYK